MNNAFFPTQSGNFRIYACREWGPENIALIYGKIKQPVLVRVHSKCITGDVFGSRRCDCGKQLEKSIKMIKKEKAGIIIYLNQEGRGIGLVNKINAYELQDKGFDTVEANHQLGFESDERNYEIAARILKKFGIEKIRLLTNNPQKINGLKINGIEILERIPLIIKSNKHNLHYLKTKKEKLGHLL